MRAMVSDFFVYINVLFSIVHLKLICHVNVPSVLLSKSADYFTKLSHHGLMTQKEAGEFMEGIEEELYELSSCRQFIHQDELDVEMKMQRFSKIPDYMVTNMELDEEVTEYRNNSKNQGDAAGFFLPTSD